MSRTGWCFAALGLLLAGLTNVSIAWDIYASHQEPELQTVSGWIYQRAREQPHIWFPAIGLFLLSTAVALWVHLFLGVGVDEP